MSRCLGEHALLHALEGEPAAWEKGHLRSCAACRARLGLLEDDLARIEAALQGPPPAVAPGVPHAAWRLALPALALATLGALALVWHGGLRTAVPGAPTPDAGTTAELAADAGLGAALAGGDGSWSRWSAWGELAVGPESEEVAALRAALHATRPCAVAEQMIYATCDETALAGWSPAVDDEEVGR